MPALPAMASQRRKSMSKMGLSGFGEGAFAAYELLIVGGLGVFGRVSLCKSDALSVGGLGVVDRVSLRGSDALSVGGLGVVGKVSLCAPGKLCDAWDASTRPSEGLSCNVTIESL